MKSFIVFSLLFLFSVWSCFASLPQPSKQEMREMLEIIKQSYYNVTDEEANILLQVHISHIQENILLGKTETEETRFLKRVAACPPVTVPPATNDARNLHPGHIEIMAAMGDSITAGFGAKDTSVFSLKEYRELSWSIGAKTNTLFTLLSQYNPNLVGASNFIGTDLSNSLNGNNGAVSGAIAEDMPSQANWLVKNVPAKFPNANDRWKLVTIWIGGNNLCKFSTCSDPNTMTSAASFRSNLKTAIDTLATMPKTFVNLVAGLDITELSKYATTMCKIVHNVACPCGTSSSSAVLNSIRARRLEYNTAMESLVVELNTNYYKTRTDFGIGYQLFLTNTLIPDKSYLSAGDCFHPAAKTHGFLATALWNNLITPTPQKKKQWKPEDNEQPICATENTRLVIDLFN